MTKARVFTVLLAVLVVLAGVAQADPPEVLRARLANGLRVIVVRDPLAPVVTTVMNYEVGSNDEAITGTAHALEHMMFRGSRTLTASQFADVTAITGGSFNANTQNRITQYYFVMPSQDLDAALRLEASRAAGLLATQKLWSQERGAITQEVTHDLSDAEYRLYVRQLRQLMAGTPYANPGLGTVRSFGRQINAPQLQAFYKTWYHPGNAVLVVAGDVQPKQALIQVEAAFGRIPAARIPARRPVKLAPLKPATFKDFSDKPYLLASLGYRFPGTDGPDYAASQVLADVFNSQRGALYELVASGQALDVGFSAQAFQKAGMAMAMLAGPTTMAPERAKALLEQVVDGYRKSGVPAELVEAAKRREVAAAEFKGNSIQGLAMEWSTAVAVEGRSSPADDVAAIEKVTVDDVNRVLRNYLDNRTATVTYAVPKHEGGVSSGAGRRGGEDHQIIPTEHRPLPAWATQILKSLRVPRQTLHPTDVTLPNGIRLIVQPESITHTVVMSGLIRINTGMMEEPNTEGVASVTEGLLPYGTTTYDRLGFQAELDKIAASVSTGTSFSLSVLAKDFDRGVQLLADDELHPRMAAKDFEIVKKQTYDSVVGNEKTPDHMASVALHKALYPVGDPSRRYATPATVKGLTLDHVKRWYARAYRPDLATIVVVGDVTPQQARAVVEKWFGAWRATGPKPAVDPPAVPDNRPATITVPDASRMQDQVSLVETLRLKRADPAYAPLAVADTVLSGGFYASMLYHHLREQRGLVYSVDTSLSVGKTRSSFSVDYGAMPAKVSAAESLAVADLKQLQRTLLPAERLQRAKALLIGEVPVRQQSYSGVASLLLGFATEGLPLDQNLRDARRELAVTPQSLRAAMRKWIRPDGFVRLTIGPKPR